MSVPLPNREQILESLRTEKKPLHAGDIAERCGVPKAAYRRFAELLEQLAADGVLTRDGSKRYRAPRPQRQAESWIGVLSVHPRGFGFVNASGKPDVYVTPEAMAGALHGDTVRIEVVAQSSRGSEGRVLEVTARRNPRVAGILRRKRKATWLEPDDTRVRGPLVLEGDVLDAADGDAAVAEITRFPESPDENPEGRIVAVLGKPGEADVEVAKIKIREQIEEEHPAAAIIEAEHLALASRRLSDTGRRDLRDVPFLTIDPKDARDHDDAVHAEATKTGTRIYVAIADVAEYVTEGSPLDAEAFRRGCTIYLPDRAIPMLPQVLAADVCSLLPEQERYCLCVIAELDKNANVQRFEVVEGLMCAAAMITYESAARTLGFTEEPPLSAQAEAFKKNLTVLANVTTKLRRARLARGALDLDLPEAQVELDATGNPVNVTRRAKDPGVKRAYQIVEELMLLANELVARWLGERNVPAIYRVHGRPDEQKLMRLGALAETLGVPCDLDELQESKGVAKWLQRIAKLERKNVLETLLLRSLKQATYDIVNIGHFGLASEAYLHFTSPIRRYPDLLVHRGVKRILRGKKPDLSPKAIEQLRLSATTASARERAAMSVEREVVDLYRALYARKHLLGEMLEGTVTALVGSGLYANVDLPFIDVMIPHEGLGSDRYELSEDELSFVGMRSGDTISLGDHLLFEIEDVSILRRTVYARRLWHGDADSPLARGAVPPRRKGGAPKGHGDGARQNRGNTGAQRKPGATGARQKPSTAASSQGQRGTGSGKARQGSGDTTPQQTGGKLSKRQAKRARRR